ncbi:MAG: sugar phosphate isomerase/epimerase [Gemmataceae bacterium]
MQPDRRHFLSAMAVLALDPTKPGGGLPVATSQYPWLTFFARDKRSWDRDLAGAVADVARAGMAGLEPIATSPGQVKALAPHLSKHGLKLRSLYVNSKVHDKADADRSLEEVLAIAAEAKKLGCEIVVTNPSPIRWGGPESKTDAQLETQAANLDRLGAELGKRGMTLAYHNHDAELRHAAREFHHMMVGTDPKKVSLCLDSHWVFRGAGDSQVALFDVVKLYGKRVVELHLRQSRGGVWTEVFGDGDIDHARLAEMLVGLAVKPHVVLEQAVEAKSPNTLGVVESHRRGREYAQKVFAPLA